MKIVKNVNILLIEDNPGDARLISELLKEIKLFVYDFTVCGTLHAGIDFLQNNSADVILLDLNLPDSSGQNTFETLHLKVPDIPIILVSGLEDEELSLKLIQLGAQDFISKGEVSFRVFEKSISYSLERNKLRASVEEELKNRKVAEDEIKKQNSILNAIINNSHSVIIFLVDQEYNYLGFNENHRKEIKKIYGADIEQGMNLLEMITIPELRSKAKASIDRVLGGETFIETEIQPDFNIYYEFHWNSVRKEGEIIGVSCFVLDISDRILSESLLIASEKKYRILVETAISGIYISNLSGELLFANNAFCNIMGYDSKEEINIIGIENIYQKKNARNDFIYALKQNHRVTNYEISVTTKNGSIKTTLFSAYLEDERITGTVIDITELVQAKKRAEQSDRLKTAFMNNISHEIRTPLNGILGFSNLIIQPGFTQEEKEKFELLINSSSMRLLNTIINYMDISMIASANIDVQKKPMSPDQLLQALWNQFKPICVLKSLDLLLKIPENSEGLLFNSDAELIRKSLSHLLDNAVKFTNRGEISFGYVILQGSLEFYVKDTGIGVSKEAQSMIFGSFVQEEISDTRGHEGSGLGLSIAQGLIRMLGGDISVLSEKGIGSTFSFNLPNEVPGDEWAGSAIQEVEIPIFEKPLLLIAEDDEPSMIYLEIILKNADIEFVKACDGKEAVESCRNHPEISLVLMDLKLPLMDGLEAAREIKLFRKDLPVIAITAFAMSGDEQNAREAGCDDYIAKPVIQKALFEKLKKYGIYGKQ